MRNSHFLKTVIKLSFTECLKEINVMNFLEELSWRGLFKDSTPGIETWLNEKMQTAYIGFDPTAPSLQIGNLVTIMMLMHFQRYGHKPVALIGGATARVGDPSGKTEERKLLSVEDIQANQERFKKQLAQFLDFENGPNAAEMVNNQDWFGKFDLMTFLRDVGKHITVNYMVAKDSVKTRMASQTGISFTEFTYQLIQGYDFVHLNKNYNCGLQMGGSDQWGNITTGTELVRKMVGAEVHALTCPLVTKADGSKFGKTETGTLWLDADMTSPYQFFQFWINSSDTDAGSYIKIFTLKGKEEIESLVAEHALNPGNRLLQRSLAEDVTLRVHGEKGLKQAELATRVLFGNASKEDLQAIDAEDFASMTLGVPRGFIAADLLSGDGLGVLDFLAESEAMASKGEGRRLLQQGGLRINKEQIKDIEHRIGGADLLNEQYLLVQKGKKDYFIVYIK